MESHESDGKKIQSVDTALDIIEYLDCVGSAPFADIVDHVGRSRSTTHYYLKTLEDRRYVSKDGDEFSVGLRFFNLGNQVLKQIDLHGIGENEVETLATKRKGVAHIFTRSREKAMVIFQTGDNKRGTIGFGMGTEIDLHVTAYGKVILANLPDDQRDAYLARDLSAVTENTITSSDQLARESETVQQLGFAFSEGEYRTGYSSIAAPIFRGTNEEVVGAVGLTKESDEIDDPTKQYKAHRFMKDLPWAIQNTARVISERIQQKD
jgi:DNA-binding IclR family transcriptional regulator